MNAVSYKAARQFEIKEVPIPEVGDNSVLIQVGLCGLCRSDKHFHNGSPRTRYPLIPGHEVVGSVAAVGKDVEGFALGDKCAVDPVFPCDRCFYCRRGSPLYCLRINGLGVTIAGGFAKYVAVDSKNVYKFSKLTYEQAIFIEPLSDAIHGLEKANPPVGADVLVLGAGPAGLMFSQLCKVGGAGKVVLAANKGIKMDLAKRYGMADDYVEVDRTKSDESWKELKQRYPYGFDVVIEATGSTKVATDAIDFLRRGGSLVLFSVYDFTTVVTWPPSKIFADEIKIVGSFAQSHRFAQSIAYLESGKIAVDGMVTDVFALEEFGQALEKLDSRAAVKIAVKP